MPGFIWAVPVLVLIGNGHFPGEVAVAVRSLCRIAGQGIGKVMLGNCSLLAAANCSISTKVMPSGLTRMMAMILTSTPAATQLSMALRIAQSGTRGRGWSSSSSRVWSLAAICRIIFPEQRKMMAEIA